MEEIKFNGRAFGKSYQQFCKFIEAIKKKEKPLVIGIDYVCMSRDMYDRLSDSGGNVGYASPASSGVQNGGLAPCDCKDEKTALQLNEQGISFNDYSLDIRPSVVSISIGKAQMQLPMSIFKRFAEWYLTKQ